MSENRTKKAVSVQDKRVGAVVRSWLGSPVCVDPVALCARWLVVHGWMLKRTVKNQKSKIHKIKLERHFSAKHQRGGLETIEIKKVVRSCAPSETNKALVEFD